MWNGKYSRWNPIPVFQGRRLYCEAVHDDWEGFRVWLRGEDKSDPMVIIKFDSKLLYVNSDEADRLSKIDSDDEMEFPHSFWRVENSSLVKEFNRQSVGVHQSEEVYHFAFLTCNDCIDVLSLKEPTIIID